MQEQPPDGRGDGPERPAEPAPTRVPQLRPLGVGDLLDELFAVYRRGFKTFVAIAAVVHIPLALLALLALPLIPTYTSLLDLLSSDATDAALRALQEGALGLGTLGLLLVVGSIAGSVLELGATCLATSAIYLGQPLGVGEAYRRALARFWPALGLAVLVFLAFLGVGMAAVILSIAAVATVGALMCVVVPAALAAFVYLAVLWSVAPPALWLEERQGALGALGRSRDLLRGAWWRVFLVLLVLTVLIGVLQGIASGLVSVLQGALQLLVAPGSLVAPAWVLAVTSLLSTAVNIFFAPLVWIGITLLYYDRRVRAEGYDLAIMARELGRRPAPDPGTP